MDPPEPSPLAPNRPKDPIEAIEYDVIKAVWARRRPALTGPAIGSALLEYWNIIKLILDDWKVETNALLQAQEKKDKFKEEYHKSRAAEQRGSMEKALRLTVLYGHKDIIERYVEILFAYKFSTSSLFCSDSLDGFSAIS